MNENKPLLEIIILLLITFVIFFVLEIKILTKTQEEPKKNNLYKEECDNEMKQYLPKKSDYNETINLKIQKAKVYLEQCKKGILLNTKKKMKIDNPKISIIIPCFNKSLYILMVLRSVQNQFFEEIEIIFIDDHSKDNTTLVIEAFQKEDQRIVLIKNEKNFGTLKTRNIGIYYSIGNYITLLDPDDMLIDNILKKTYSIAICNNSDIITFLFIQNKKRLEPFGFHISEPISQPKLSTFMFYETGKLEQKDWFLWAKLIRRKTIISALYTIQDYHIEQYMTMYEDGLVLFMLFKKAKSYLCLKEFGYYYFTNSESITKAYSKNCDQVMKNIFLYLEYLFIYTENNPFEKAICFYVLKRSLNIYGKCKKKVTKNIEYIKSIFNLYLKCEYFSFTQKREIKEIMLSMGKIMTQKSK